VKVSRRECIGGAGGCPAIGARIVPPARVKIELGAAANPAPDDHLAPGPSCCVKQSAFGRICRAGSCPAIGAGIVSATGVQRAAAAPDDHLGAGPYRRVSISGSWRVGGASRCPTVGARVVSAAGVQIAAVKSAPDDHLTAGPYCRV
jgi:hypothetical protein